MIVAFVGALACAAAAPIDADEAVRRALANAPALAAQQADLDRERSFAGRVKLDPLSLGLEHRGVEQIFGPRLDKNGDPYGPLDRGYAELAWSPPHLGDIGFAQSIAGMRADASAEDLEASRRAIAADVRLLHAHILLLREERALVKDAVVVDERVRDAVAQRLQAEAATQLDASLADLDVLDVQLDLEDVEAQLARSEARLAHLVGVDALELSGTVPACSAPPEKSDVLTRARIASPRLRALVLRRAALEREAIKAGLRYIPWIDKLKVAYLNQPIDKRDELRAGVDIDIPVFAFFDGTGSDVELRGVRLDAEQREAEDDLAVDVESAVQRLHVAAELVEKHAAATDVITAKSTAAVDEALASGRADTISAAQVHARALKSRRAHLRARERCVEAVLDVQRLTGDVVPAQ